MTVQELEIKKVPINLIKFDDSNPNQLTNEQMESLKLVMEKYGYLAPVILNKDFTIIDGEHRVRVYQKLDKKNIQAYVIDVDNIDSKILRQLMNKLRGEHDKQKDALEYKIIYETKRLEQFSKLIAQPKTNFERILENKFQIQFHKEEDKVPKTRSKTDIKMGEMFQLGNHKLLCGDCTNPDHVRKLLSDKKVDQLNTDPPYGVAYGEKNKFLNSIAFANRIETPIENDAIKNYREFFKKFLGIIPYSFTNTVYLTISGQKLLDLSLALLETEHKISQYLVWKKNNHVLGRQDYSNIHELIIYGWKGKHKFFEKEHRTTVLEYDRPHISDLHPIMKPVKLIAQMITDATEEGMLVYDPFLGSGTTLIASEQTNRTCFGIEIDPIYCQVIIDRWQNHTGKKATKISSS